MIVLITMTLVFELRIERMMLFDVLIDRGDLFQDIRWGMHLSELPRLVGARGTV
jgi:hypothetical protein